MSRTSTSSFGTGRRESHDSSAFYSRNMLSSTTVNPLSAEGIMEIIVPEVGEWANRIYCSSAEQMAELPDNSVALAFTSPPYNVGKDYDDDMSLKDYLALIGKVGSEVYRTLRPGGRDIINI